MSESQKHPDQARREAILEGMVIGYESALDIVSGHLEAAESSLPIYELKRAKENISASLEHFRRCLAVEKRNPSIPPVVDEYAFPPNHQPFQKPFFGVLGDVSRTQTNRAPYTTVRGDNQNLPKTPIIQEIFNIGGVRVSVGDIPAGCVIAVDGDKLYLVELGVVSGPHSVISASLHNLIQAVTSETACGTGNGKAPETP